jgi:hypothetical protein
VSRHCISGLPALLTCQWLGVLPLLSFDYYGFYQRPTNKNLPSNSSRRLQDQYIIWWGQIGFTTIPRYVSR